MEFATLSTRRRGVSQVIGVILIVAITVVLSAIIGTYVLGIGVSQDTVPQSTWKAEYTSGSPDELTLTHDSGDRMEPDRLNVVVTGASCSSGSLDSPKNLESDYGITETISASTSVTIDGSELCGGDIDLSSATVRLVWEDEDTDGQADSDTLLVWEGPDA